MIVPSEPLRAHAPGFYHIAGRKWQAGHRVLVRFVPNTQFDRIHPDLYGQFVDRRFECERPDRLSRCAHESVGERVHFHRLDGQVETRRRIARLCAEDERFGYPIMRCHGGHSAMDQRHETPIGIRADCDALPGWGATADPTINAFARQRDAHRSSGELGCCCAQNLMIPKAFAAEATTNIG